MLKCLDNKWAVRLLSDSLKNCYLAAEIDWLWTTQLGFTQNKLMQPLQSLLVTSYLFFKCFSLNLVKRDIYWETYYVSHLQSIDARLALLQQQLQSIDNWRIRQSKVMKKCIHGVQKDFFYHEKLLPFQTAKSFPFPIVHAKTLT